MTDKIYPDAIVRDGIVTDLITGDELPSYSGLCLADCSGRMAVMFTHPIEDEESIGRRWEFVHWGPVLSTTEINRFMKEKRIS